MREVDRLANILQDTSYLDVSNEEFWWDAAEQLIANGVIVPPCKVGDTVYRVMGDKRIKQPYEYKVVGFWYLADETCNDVHLVRCVNGVFDCSISVPISEFGKIVFLSREEAEEALAERSKG